MKALHFGRFYNGSIGRLERVVSLLLKGFARPTRFTWCNCVEKRLAVYRKSLQAAGQV